MEEHMHRSLVLVATVTGFTLGLSAMAIPNPPAPKSKAVVVKAVDLSATAFRFEPTDITVNLGDTVRFVQTTAMPHNVEFKVTPPGANLGDARMGPFMLAPGEKYEIVIDSRFTVGKYGFVCTPHEAMGMKGTITVTAGGK
jgi:plastocyanin